ncbi:swarming motility protein SwrB [Lysinibacillus sp. PLM2]|nr:swarming motility protein SwrB [Lysinibacillus sp. PLM2]
MITILVVLLIVSQLFCFYLIAILNAKVAKFQELEVKQNQLLREMEDTIGLYLVEMKEENDRLIQELSTLDKGKKVQTKNADTFNSISQVAAGLDDKVYTESEKADSNSLDLPLEKKIQVPKAIVQNAYNKYKSPSVETTVLENKNKFEANQPNVEGIPFSFEDQVLKLHGEGKSIEEIAKLTNKGKTEIELFIKFNT